MWAARRSASGQICTEDTIQPTHRCPLAIIALLTIVLVGCSPKSPSSEESNPVEKAASKSEEDLKKRTIVTGKLTLESSSNDGQASWRVNGNGARAGLKEGGSNEFFLEGVTGEIFENKKTSSTFSATEAKAATETKKLVLTGNVKLTSVPQKVSLTADKITWMEDKELFAATGNVQINSPEWQLGNMNEVWATPDLSKIGTPSKFK